MSVPVWLTYAVAAAVTVFGLYRLKLALRSRAEELNARKRGGMYGLPRRTHLLFGILYLILGGFLLAAGLGYVRSPFSQEADKPAPVEPGVEVIEVQE